MSSKNNLPLMPKATAVWLVDNTSLSFKQIADFCGIHELEVKGIADGEVATGIMGMNPITGGQVTKEEIERCSQNHSLSLHLSNSESVRRVVKSKKGGGKYTPIASRQNKPDAIFWLLKNFPDITDHAICKLIGTTKNTLQSIRERTHWNMSNIRPRDPVLLGICSQTELERVTSNLKNNLSAHPIESETSEKEV
jgi:hypothetical protein